MPRTLVIGTLVASALTSGACAGHMQPGPLPSPRAAFRSTVDSLTPGFFQEIRRGGTSHLEIETYTFDVIPPELHPGDVVKSIAREYQWVLEKLA